MEKARSMSTPMASTTKLVKDEEGKSVDETTYRGMIGSLLYLTASRPDIMFSVCICARFQSCPTESHMTAVKRILRYLVGTSKLYLWYPIDRNFDLKGYSDQTMRVFIDRKSTSGIATFVGPCIISWASKKQNSVALSTAESEYIAAALRYHYFKKSSPTFPYQTYRN
ncbi:secreted RxLR effector protein 161-like [Silene latifolia]|uniref:secreted RxLR effector protein 161-like n=1 Tax=Silene latifolia TaxID=37657 RepID=UPI003D77A632